LGGGPPCFPPDCSCPVVLAVSGLSQPAFAYGTLTLSGGPFQQPSASPAGCSLSAEPAASAPGPSNPSNATAAALCTLLVWAPPVSFATTPGLFSFPQGTKMVQFPCLPRVWLCVHQTVTGYHPGRVAPFGFPRLSACPQLPEAFRRVATSFIGPRHPGIPRVPSVPFVLLRFSLAPTPSQYPPAT
jgi:hypothetical protein